MLCHHIATASYHLIDNFCTYYDDKLYQYIIFRKLPFPKFSKRAPVWAHAHCAIEKMYLISTNTGFLSGMLKCHQDGYGVRHWWHCYFSLILSANMLILYYISQWIRVSSIHYCYLSYENYTKLSLLWKLESWSLCGRYRSDAMSWNTL